MMTSRRSRPGGPARGRRLRTGAAPGDAARRSRACSVSPTTRTGHDVDLVVVGAGPAGLAAAVYAASEGLVTVLLDAAGAGGQAATSSRIENYLGFPRGVSGDELTRRALVQAQKFGAQLYAPLRRAWVGPSDPAGPTLNPPGRHPLSSPRRDRRHRRTLPAARRAAPREIRKARPRPILGHRARRSRLRVPARHRGRRRKLRRARRRSSWRRGARASTWWCAGDRHRGTMSTYLAERLEAHPMVRLWRTGPRLSGSSATAHSAL